METPSADTTTPLIWDQLPTVAHVETDRFCEHCGYNLLTQAVRREPRTQILLTRCPECGRYHPAGETTTVANIWLRRLAMLGLAAWILFLVNFVFWALFVQGAMTYVTLEELTLWTEVPRSVREAPGYRGYGYWRQVNHDVRNVEIMYAVLGSVSLGLGFVTTWAATVVVPHWPRRAYTAMAVGLPVLPAFFVALIWRDEAPHLLRWSAPYISGHLLLCVLGGLIAAMIGRPLARLIVRIFLPSRARAVLAYLWLVDGKTPPAAEKRSGG